MLILTRILSIVAIVFACIFGWNDQYEMATFYLAWAILLGQVEGMYMR